MLAPSGAATSCSGLRGKKGAGVKVEESMLHPMHFRSNVSFFARGRSGQSGGLLNVFLQYMEPSALAELLNIPPSLFSTTRLQCKEWLE